MSGPLQRGAPAGGKHPFGPVAFPLRFYLDQGWSVIPLEPRGKKPLIPWSEFQKRRPTWAEVEKWWTQWPDANIGIVTGAVSDLVVWDLDGLEAIEYAKKKGVPGPGSPMVRTSKGFHLYFAHPGEEVPNATALGGIKGLDVRGDGGYVVAPPSLHPSGITYSWVHPPGGDPLPAYPSWVLEFHPTPPLGLRTPDAGGPQAFLPGVPEGQRNTTAARLAGHWLAQGGPPEEAWARLKAWNERNIPPLPERELRTVFDSILRREEGKKKSEAAPRRPKKKSEERKPTRQQSFFIDGETLFEQVYVGGKSFFLAFNTSGIKTVPFWELEEEILEPLQGEDIELGAVKLPSGVEEYGTLRDLLAEIEGHICRYLDVSPHFLRFASSYVLLSWVYDRFRTLPYLRALGDTGCGKSRFLDVIGGLCYKPVSASGCVTPASLYRLQRRWGGTLVLDEADMKNSDEYNEVVTILNCGFERGRPVVRAIKDNPDKIQFLPVFGPKVLATRRRFEDAALEARCLTEIMQETERDDIPPVLGKKFFEEQKTLRNRLLLFRLRNFFKIDPEATAGLRLDDIEPRLKQISEAFVSLFANEPEVLEDYQQFIRAHQRELVEQRAATKAGQVVEALFALIEERGGPGTTGTSTRGDSGTGVSAGDIAARTGLSAQAIGMILKGLGVETQRSRRGQERRREILFNEAVFRKLRKRYIVPAEAEPEGPQEEQPARCPP